MNRRNFLVTSGSVLTITSIAGCMNNTIEEYPDGLSEEGVEDAEALFGPESPYMSSESVQLVISTDSDNQSSETTIRTNSDQERSFVETVSQLPEQAQNEGEQITVRYHTGTTRYQRRTTENSDGDVTSGPRYSKNENEFTKNVEFYSNFMQDLLTDVTFSESTITDEGLIEYTSEEVGSNNSLSPDSQQVESISMVVRFREDGKPDSIEATIEVIEQQQPQAPTQDGSSEEDTENDSDQETRTINQNITFSDYDSVEVEEPDWLEEADQQVEERRANQPDGNVSFSEGDGSVTVTIESLENTDTVDIVVDGQIQDQGVSEGESLTYDGASSIQVVTQTQNGSLIRIGTYGTGN